MTTWELWSKARTADWGIQCLALATVVLVAGSGAVALSAARAGISGRSDAMPALDRVQSAAALEQLVGVERGTINGREALQLTMAEPFLTFASGSASLSDEAIVRLDRIFRGLDASRTRIRLRGHTDDRGDNGFNQILSEQRARSVAGYLMAMGAKQGWIELSGAGELVPVADNSSPRGRSLNRRVEIELVALSFWDMFGDRVRALLNTVIVLVVGFLASVIAVIGAGRTAYLAWRNGNLFVFR